MNLLLECHVTRDVIVDSLTIFYPDCTLSDCSVIVGIAQSCAVLLLEQRRLRYSLGYPDSILAPSLTSPRNREGALPQSGPATLPGSFRVLTGSDMILSGRRIRGGLRPVRRHVIPV
ncbi:hypothetical protein Y032_0147g2608 [Ancylostoma ceylanicum]|uniref:Uncharacterized protein n=1 Tax=Ancylostoma ceylanicum TaxID=53326 RepID=A0A016T2I2_9BILA|nr:hypothetical protein Y032_0147g2608 [Ancylostoma ceylanicum]